MELCIFKFESTNPRRLVTGLLLGILLVLSIGYTSIFVEDKLKTKYQDSN